MSILYCDVCQKMLTYGNTKKYSDEQFDKLKPGQYKCDNCLENQENKKE